MLLKTDKTINNVMTYKLFSINANYCKLFSRVLSKRQAKF